MENKPVFHAWLFLADSIDLQYERRLILEPGEPNTRFPSIFMTIMSRSGQLMDALGLLFSIVARSDRRLTASVALYHLDQGENCR